MASWRFENNNNNNKKDTKTIIYSSFNLADNVVLHVAGKPLPDLPYDYF